MAKRKRTRTPKPAGWREWVGLPGLGVQRIKAKLDSGARTSALHAVRLKSFTKDGADWVRFVVHPRQRTTKGSLKIEAPVVEWRNVTSSNGQRQERPMIITELSMFGDTWAIEVTLTNRVDLGFRMLLGREAMRGRVLVDSSRSYVGGRPTMKRSAKKIITKSRTRKGAKAKKAAKKTAKKVAAKKTTTKTKRKSSKAPASAKPISRSQRKATKKEITQSTATKAVEKKSASKIGPPGKKASKKVRSKKAPSRKATPPKPPARKAISKNAIPKKSRSKKRSSSGSPSTSTKKSPTRKVTKKKSTNAAKKRKTSSA